jgi:hypothetical protein
VLLGDHQEVNRCLGVDVVKSIAHIVLIHLAGGNFSGNDLAE